MQCCVCKLCFTRNDQTVCTTSLNFTATLSPLQEVISSLSRFFLNHFWESVCSEDCYMKYLPKSKMADDIWLVTQSALFSRVFLLVVQVKMILSFASVSFPELKKNHSILGSFKWMCRRLRLVWFSRTRNCL